MIYDNIRNGDTYLVQYDDDPQEAGERFYNAFLEICNLLEGDVRYSLAEHDPDLVEHVIRFVGYPGLESDPFEPETAAAYIDEQAKRKGGTGWLA